MSFLLSSFLLSQFPPCWASCRSLSLPLHWVFLMFSFHGWSFCRVCLLLCLASALPWPNSPGCFRQVKSKSWHHICLQNVWFTRFCLATGKIWSNGWTSVIAQFYLANKGKYILKAWGWADPKDEKRRETPAQFWLFFLYVFSLPPEPALCKLG